MQDDGVTELAKLIEAVQSEVAALREMFAAHEVVDERQHAALIRALERGEERHAEVLRALSRGGTRMDDQERRLTLQAREFGALKNAVDQNTVAMRMLHQSIERAFTRGLVEVTPRNDPSVS